MGILGELWVKLGLKNDDLKKGLDESKKEVSGFTSAIKKVGGAIAAAFTVEKILSFTHQTAELANKAAGVKKAFDKLNSPGLLSDLRRATMGTVDDLQLMQRAVQANNFKIPLDQLATYLQFATQRANETGQSVDYLVDSIITGLGRQSVLILDNLGISAAEIRDNMKDGASMAEAVGKIIKEQMGDSAAAIDEAALATQRLSAAWTNFQLAFGEGTKGPWNWIKGQLAGVLDMMTRVMNAKGFSFWEKLGMVFGGVNADENREKLLNQEKARQEKENAAMQSAKAQVEAIKTIEDAYKELKILEQDRLKLAGKPEDDPFVLRNKYALQYLKEYIENEEKKAKSVKSLVQQLEDEIAAKEQLRDLSANEDEIRKLNDEIAAMKERLKVLQMSTEEYKKYRNEQMKPIPEMQSGLSGIFDTKYLEQNANKGAKILDEASKQWKEKTIQLNGEAIAQQQVTLEAINALNSAITSGVTASLSELANVIGGVENADVGSVVSALLSPLADACISAGMLIMTTGKGIEAMRDGLITFFGGNAIAAGAAMMAIGVAAKAGLAAIGKNAASGGYSNQSVTSYSGGYGVNAANYSQSNAYTLTTTLKGQDLLLAIQRTENNNRR